MSVKETGIVDETQKIPSNDHSFTNETERLGRELARGSIYMELASNFLSIEFISC